MQTVVYKTIPDMFDFSQQAAGCFCECENKILFLRKAQERVFGGTWAIPGGKLRYGELPLDGILRELLEETGCVLDGRVLSYIIPVYIKFADIGDFTFHLFRAKLNTMPDKIALSKEHTSFMWLDPLEAFKLTLMPGEKECIEIVYSDKIKGR